ncbi:MAG TPA: peptidylprolyl isomerase [Saprospiraceae bacterium]|jgi:peptidyl-prolyl cis-trans isomerase SurA|nr:peptidylprolyl isomerase [Saprospiraceae bacterium]HMT69713.1 peptidylprolyl isomerase [Saprospiraceae bacterium]
MIIRGGNIILVVCFMTCFVFQGYTQLVDKVIAKVGSEYILLSEIEEEFAYAKSKDPGVSDDIKCVILDNMIAQKLVIYHAKIDSVEITDAEVETQLDYRFESVLRQMNGDEAFFEEYYGASVAEMKERYRDDQKHKILAEKMQHKLISEIEITPKEVEKFFKNVPSDSLPYFKSEMEISEIVSLPLVNDVERQKALDKIKILREKVVNGTETFADIATKNSQDPGSAARGGDLGFAKRGVYVPEFEATVFSLAKDEISDIIETEFGYHFIQLIERRGNSVRARHVLIKPEITQADLDKTKVLLDSVRQLITIDSLSFENAVKKYSVKSVPSYANGGRVKNQNSNNTFFAADDLDPDTYFAIYDLKPGAISKPMLITMPDGKKAYRLIQLNSTSKPHKANLKEDFDKISNFAKESKKNEYFLNWLKTKRTETYIYTDPLFSYCKTAENN